MHRQSDRGHDGAEMAVPASITPVLTVRDAAAAVDYYAKAFGAVEVHRSTDPDGRVVVELRIGAARIRIADEAPDVGNLGPDTLGGTSVRLNLLVADPDAVARRAIAAGATELAPVTDQPYGLRQGRLRDPYGHHWLIGRPLTDPSGDWARADSRDLINGLHAIVLSPAADAVRTFLQDTLELSHVDAGGGWLIFGLPAAELAVHPAGQPGHEIYLMTDDLDAAVARLSEQGIQLTRPIREQHWGRMVAIALPGGGELPLYQPTHPRPAQPP
jgi:PhnB protein